MSTKRPERLEWTAEISSTSRFYYVRVPKVYGKKYHNAQVRVIVEILPEEKTFLRR
ncbi:hypothetical protein ES703_57847 [subsurface metagenome]